jgi:Domain of unknown function (DUF4422)
MSGKIFVVTHIKPDKKLPKGYDYIGVGSRNLNLSYSDMTGESIAKLNPYFSELTAIYWIWKNFKCHSDDFVGIMHYRRVLVDGRFSALKKKPIDIKNIEKILTSKDLIVPEKTYLPPNCYHNYAAEHDQSDLNLVLSIAESRDGVEKGTYLKFLNNLKTAHICNILICKKRIFDAYCSWLFPILFESLETISSEGRDAYQKRAFGFLSERLFNVWLYGNGYEIEQCRMIRTDFSFVKNFNRRRLNNRWIND